jgi:hypothetical protein
MWNDPIVEEVRTAGEKLAQEADYDLHVFFQNLRNNEIKRKPVIVSKILDIVNNRDIDEK